MITKTQTSGIIHIIGAALAVAALTLLVIFSAIHASAWHIVSFSIYGASMIILYTMSSLYHMFREGSTVRKVFQVLDHCSIYLLIAGTYTPVCLIPLNGGWGWTIFGIVWGLAVLGIVWKCVDRNIAQGISRKISTLIYIIMGWMIIIAFYPLIKTVPIAGIFYLVLGGIMYTIGGIIYGLKKPSINCEWFGHHEVFHIFVVLGSACHFWFMFKYLMFVTV